MITDILKQIVLLGILIFIFIFPFSILNKIIKDVNLLNVIKAFTVYIIVALYCYFTKDMKDNFHFELTPEKYCDGGSYMRSSSPEKQALCSKFSATDLARYDCPNGFIGRPIWRQGAGNMPLSDGDWQNTTCKQIGKDLPDPQVL